VNVLVVGHAPIRQTNRDVYRALARHGLDITLLVPERWRSAFGDVTVEPEDSGLHIVARPIGGRYHSNMYWFSSGVGALAQATRADAIYVDEDPAGFVAAQAAGAARRVGAGLVVLAVQNIYKRYPPPFGFIQHRVLRQAGAALTNSEAATATLRRRGYCGPFFEKPLTTEAGRLATPVRAAVRKRYGMREPTFGYVGRLVPEKGIDVFLHALARFDGAFGIVVGDGPERRALAALAARLGLEARVTFAPAVSPGEATAVIGALDVLVLPSRTTRAWSEQFGRVLVEAMAAGVPVVASRSGAIPQTVGDAGLLVSEGCSDELARAMRLLFEPEVAARYRRRGLERVARKFTPKAVAASLESALRQASRPAAR
jgi:glycosyltransferase involved in cell wall biosynthesis